MPSQAPEIVQFSNESRSDRRALRAFVDFHWRHYRDDPQYVPQFDIEYLGSRLFGVTGLFEPRSPFFRYAEMAFFLARVGGEVVGRCAAFVNRRHNQTWSDKVGFFGHFESIDDPQVAGALLDAAERWLRARGLEAIRGPQNLPFNDATPGLMTAGFDSRPMVYYPYNKPYYERLLLEAGFAPLERALSWELPIDAPVDEIITRVVRRAREVETITLETWGERPVAERKREMLEIYNDAWSDNFGFVPFGKEEYDAIVDGMLPILDKKFFVFAYVGGAPAGFMGVVPNVLEKMKPSRGGARRELWRSVRMLLSLGSVQSVRLGWIGVKKPYRLLGLEALMLLRQREYARSKKHLRYFDMGYVWESNRRVVRMIEMFSAAERVRTFTLFQKPLSAGEQASTAVYSR